uniref:Uncharacterized protein n=1 Tax=Meloidogyne enterolobii TaxID=390850 RepID=A0A6V7WKJ7_MELEN|nr:unnamed protein product [Meloidogyne enterolobii]
MFVLIPGSHACMVLLSFYLLRLNIKIKFALVYVAFWYFLICCWFILTGWQYKNCE